MGVEPDRRSTSWLPYFALPLSMAGMLAICAQLFFDWRRRAIRRSLPGFSTHFVLRIADTRAPRRRNIFDLAGIGQPGGTFYLSASDRFVFTISDVRGEPHSIEIPTGHHGIPIAHLVYISLEAGTDGQRTEMRILRNGTILGARTLPFAIKFGKIDFTGKLGADRNGLNRGGFELFEFVALERTLAQSEASKMTTYFRSKFDLEG